MFYLPYDYSLGMLGFKLLRPSFSVLVPEKTFLTAHLTVDVNNSISECGFQLYEYFLISNVEKINLKMSMTSLYQYMYYP